MDELPYCVRIIQALGPSILGFATAAVAGIVAYVSFRNWRTSQQKVRLDLFDRRFEVYMDVRLIATHDGRSQMPTYKSNLPMGAPATRNFDPGLPNELIARGRFLFDEDITSDLEALHGLVTRVETGDVSMAPREIRTLFDEMRPKFDKYMKFGTQL